MRDPLRFVPTRVLPLLVTPLLAAAVFAGAPAVTAQEHGDHGDHAAPASPYADLLDREIRALSAEEVEGLLEGEGMGFALAAELNGYPGPRHVLELEESLQLTPDQIERTRAVMQAMSAEARRLGAEVVSAERALDRAFREGSIDRARLREATERIGALRGELRGVHLAAHIDVTEILTPHQRHRYEQLRGDGAAREQEAGGAAVGFTGEVKPVLYVADVETAAPYFRDVLGFDLLGYTDLDGSRYYAELAAGPLKFGLHEPLNDEQEGWVGHQRLYFRVTDLAVHRARVQEAGGGPSETVETGWMDFFIVRDPAGHQIVFAVTDPERHSIDPWMR